MAIVERNKNADLVQNSIAQKKKVEEKYTRVWSIRLTTGWTRLRRSWLRKM